MSAKKCTIQSITFEKNPGHLKGLEFGEEHGIQAFKMPRRYQILAVKGHVKWKVHGSGDPAVSLKLKRGRFDKTRQLLKIQLAERRGINDGRVLTQPIDISWKLDPKGRSNKSWHVGDPGEALLRFDVQSSKLIN